MPAELKPQLLCQFRYDLLAIFGTVGALLDLLDNSTANTPVCDKCNLLNRGERPTQSVLDNTPDIICKVVPR